MHFLRYCPDSPVDKGRFGYKMLQKMGWTEGKGLGREENGSSTHVKVDIRQDNLGMLVECRNHMSVVIAIVGLGALDDANRGDLMLSDKMNTFDKLLKTLAQEHTADSSSDSQQDAKGTGKRSGSKRHVSRNRVT